MKRIEKVNKKALEYKLTVISNTKNYSFIIDASMPFNKRNFLTKWYVLNLKIALKKYLINNDPAKATLKAAKYVNQKFKQYFKNNFPYISLGICKKESETLQILVLNSVTCYLKTNKLELIENKEISNFDTKNNKMEYKKLFNKINDSTNFICYEIPYEKAFSILLFNKEFQSYQKYLNIKSNEFYDLISNEGLRYCYNHLKRIEEKDKNKKQIPRFKQLDDIVAIYKILL